MSGIIVGVDGSSHSRRALEWAMHEAAVRVVTGCHQDGGYRGGRAA